MFRSQFGGAALVALALVSAAPLHGQHADSLVSAPVANVHYQVRADRAAMAARRLHVTTTFDVSGTAPVLLSLPLWTPGAYETGDFARNVAGFSASAHGVALPWDKADYDTWRVRPGAAGTVTVDFDVQVPNDADNAATWTRHDLAFFNGTNVFPFPEGRSLDFPSTVTVIAESSDRVATALPWTGTGRTYRAATYPELVDAPVMVGAFDLDSARIAARTVRYATYPVGSVTGTIRSDAWEQLRRLIQVEANVFGEVPWPSYTLLQVVDSASGGYSGLEHAGSQLDLVAPVVIGSDYQPSLYAHELFHAWNVKRLRPADLTPYQYDRRQPTPWLWVSEGITDYYADLAEVRAGVIDVTGFYGLTAGKIAEIAGTVPFALEDASLNAWIHPRDGTAQSYYPKGSLAGFLLDIAIRDASDNQHSLDTVMRELYQTTYKKGRGFTAADWWGAVQRAANGRSFAEFDARYVNGRDPYPWDSVLTVIGLRLVADSTPLLGLQTTTDSSGAVRIVAVTPDGPAARAGVVAGDRLLRVGDVPVNDNQFPITFRARYITRAAGSPLPIVVQRAGASVTLKATLVFAPWQAHLEEIRGASARAVRIRHGILRGTTDE